MLDVISYRTYVGVPHSTGELFTQHPYTSRGHRTASGAISLANFITTLTANSDSVITYSTLNIFDYINGLNVTRRYLHTRQPTQCLRQLAACRVALQTRKHVNNSTIK